jgi:hypothetical protein
MMKQGAEPLNYDEQLCRRLLRRAPGGAPAAKPAGHKPSVASTRRRCKSIVDQTRDPDPAKC